MKCLNERNELNVICNDNLNHDKKYVQENFCIRMWKVGHDFKQVDRLGKLIVLHAKWGYYF